MRKSEAIGDIAGREQSAVALRESGQFAQGAINALSGHLAILDENGIIIMVNRPWREFAIANSGNVDVVCEGANYFGACGTVSAEECTDAGAMIAGFRAVLEGRRDEFKMEYPCDSPTEKRWFQAKMTRFSVGNSIYAVVVHDDITEQVRAAENILKINRQLEEATAKAQRATASKSDCLANMSHEIRTPMAAVVGLSHLLSDTELSDIQRDYVERIHLAGTALVGVLNDILDYSKIEAGHMRIEAVQIRIEKILEKCKTLFQIQAESKKLALRFELAPTVPQVLMGDPLRLLQVINNLVGNALKFTKSGGIDVCVDCLEQTAQGVLLKLRVKDTGIGLTPDQRERLFGAFQQGDRSTTREYGGTGLGLSISKRLAELMGGEIGVESVLGEGSTFWFTARLGLPAEGQANDVAAAKADNSMAELGRIAAPIRGARVLIVDDSATNLLVAKAYLHKMGLEVETADNGQTAVNLAKRGSYDAILMDLQMPGMDGFAAARMIREQEAGDGNPAVPIIALTAAVMSKDMRATEGAGMNDHVSKPVDPFALAAMLVKWIPPRLGRNDGVGPAL